MRRTALSLSLLAAGLLAGCAAAPAPTFSANLAGANEVPPVPSPGSGGASATLSPGLYGAGSNTVGAYRVLRIDAVYGGLSSAVTAGHVHCPAAPGANAPVAIAFYGNLASPYTATASVSPGLADQLANGQCYVNIHTLQYPTGEIRGWFTAQ